MHRWLLSLPLLALSLGAFAAPASCTAPEYHQLDFWLGDWDTFNPDGSGPSQARNRVTSLLGGCVILENYQQNNGHMGESFNIYDATRKVWHQTWVTNRGELWVLEGTFKDGVLTMTATTLDGDGKPVRHRATWQAQGKGVREIAWSSKDDGKTWGQDFDILFLPHH